jgi:hypothetical protein
MKKQTLWFMIPMTIFYAFAIGISAMALTWIDKLEKIACKCSQDFKRDYIKYFLYVYVIILALAYFNTLLVVFEWNGKLHKILQKLLRVLIFVVPIALLLNSIFSIIYIHQLKEVNCKCSEDVRREIYYIVNWIHIGFIALQILIGIFAAIFGVIIAKS